MPTLQIEPPTWTLGACEDPLAWATARFLVHLAEVLGWPPGVVPPELDARLELDDPSADDKARRLLRLWTSLLDERLDPLAGERRSVGARPAVGGAGSRRTLLGQALTERRCVRLTYTGRTRGLTTRRTVEPRALERARGQEYLRAFCHWRQAERVFRLDMILEVTLLDERFAPVWGDDDTGPATTTR
jgi:predicted DNA-binding transcriptional regulator YafY